MHILIVTTYFEPDSGAAAVRLSRLARILAQRGHTVTVLTTLPHYPTGHIAEFYRKRFTIEETRGGVRVIRTWLYATPSPKISRKLISQNSFMLTALLRSLELRRPDVMLIEAQPIFTGFAGGIIATYKNVPYVLNVSDLWPDHLLSVGALSENHPIYRTARTLVDTMYKGAAGIVAMSPVWGEKIAGYIGTDENIQVIYNGVDLQRFHPDQNSSAFRETYDLHAPNLITFIGTFATQYDFEAMFAVAERFKDREDTQFAFIGGGSQAETVEQFNLPHVRRIPWIHHAEIPQAWAASTLTYWMMRDQPLYKGTIPAKLYEALAMGVPVIAAMEGAGATIIAESGGGLSVKCGDASGLTKAIQNVLGSPELRNRYKKSGRSYAETHFDPEWVAERYENTLKVAIN